MAVKPNKNPAEVNECKDALLEAIYNSEIFKRYETAREQMRLDPELYARVNEFRKKSYILQKERNLLNSLDMSRSLYRERQELRTQKLASEFLEAELEICRLLQRISLDIISSVDLDLKSFEDAINS